MLQLLLFYVFFFFLSRCLVDFLFLCAGVNVQSEEEVAVKLVMFWRFSVFAPILFWLYIYEVDCISWGFVYFFFVS